MSDAIATRSSASMSGLLSQRTGGKPSKRAAASAFWRMLGLVRPHRRAMITGVVLGFGVAMTYAASLGGILPVLKVVLQQKSLRAELHHVAEQGAKWYAPAAGFIADWLPPADAPGAGMTTLLILLGVLLALNLLGNGLRVLSQYLVLYATHRSMMDLRRKMYAKALRMPMVELSSEISDTVNQFMSDTREIFLGITTLFGKVAREPLKAICVLIVALVLDARLTIAVLVIAPIAVLVLWYFGRIVRKAAVQLLQGYGRMLGGLEEALQGIDTVKGYAREGHERRRMWQLERTMLKQQLRLAWIEAISSPALELVGVLAALAGIVWLAGRTFRGEISPDHFVTMVILLAALLDPVRKIANVYNVVQRSGAAASRVFAFLDRPDQPVVRTTTLPPRQAREVRFENITFRYHPSAPEALHDVDLRVAPGECIAVVGPNGSGKSTLMKLLPRLLEPQDGRILVDNHEVRDLSLRALRQEIALVPQRPVIFARSVRDNLAYGHEHATPAEVRAAARRAFAADFIEAWPDGYDTVLGEFGASISGGQRQRIAIARAFLKPASILIFDEATSEIDAESEQKIHAALNELRKGKTTFLIAHRHTVMEIADRIVVMDAGQIVDTGTHAELLQRCPLYQALYRSPLPH